METTSKQVFEETRQQCFDYQQQYVIFYNQLKLWLEEFPIDFTFKPVDITATNINHRNLIGIEIVFEFDGKIKNVGIYPNDFSDRSIIITGFNYQELYFLPDNNNELQLYLTDGDGKNVLLTKTLFFEKILNIPYDINNWKVKLNRLNLDDSLNLSPVLLSELDTVINKLLESDKCTKIDLFGKLINTYFSNITDICDVHTKAIEFFYTIDSKKQCFDLDEDLDEVNFGFDTD